MRVKPTGVSWREVDGEVIALDLESSTYFSTNASGTPLWHALLGEGSDLDGLAALLTSTFDVDDTRARSDAASFLDLLEQHGLLDHAG